MKYILNKKIFYANLIIGVLLVAAVISMEGLDVVKKRTETISCPSDAYTSCLIRTPQGDIIELIQGQEITINKFNENNLKIANYGVWILIMISVTINHLIYNRKYPIKKEIKKLIKHIKRDIRNF